MTTTASVSAKTVAVKPVAKLIKMPQGRAVFKTAARNYYVPSLAAPTVEIYSQYVGRIKGGTEPVKRKRVLRTDSPLYAQLVALIPAAASGASASA